MNFIERTIVLKITVIGLLLMLLLTGANTASAQLAANPDSILVRRRGDTSRPGVVLTQTGLKTKAPKFRYDSGFSPQKATIRSAIIPGWGQVYNHQVWKLPFVYGAIGVTAGIFIYNVKGYRDLRKMYILITDKDTNNDYQIPKRFEVLKDAPNSVKFYRDEFRRNVDYSVLAFLLAWGLNVVDATVAAHLRQFDVSDDLSLQIKPTLSPTGTIGIGLVMNIK